MERCTSGSLINRFEASKFVLLINTLPPSWTMAPSRKENRMLKIDYFIVAMFTKLDIKH